MTPRVHKTVSALWVSFSKLGGISIKLLKQLFQNKKKPTKVNTELEVLTDSGWKYINQLSTNDKLVTSNGTVQILSIKQPQQE